MHRSSHVVRSKSKTSAQTIIIVSWPVGGSLVSSRGSRQS